MNMQTTHCIFSSALRQSCDHSALTVHEYANNTLHIQQCTVTMWSHCRHRPHNAWIINLLSTWQHMSSSDLLTNKAESINHGKSSMTRPPPSSTFRPHKSHTHTHTHERLTALCLGLPGWASTRRQNQSGFKWSKRQWVAVASDGPYANLHLAPDR